MINRNMYADLKAAHQALARGITEVDAAARAVEKIRLKSPVNTTKLIAAERKFLTKHNDTFNRARYYFNAGQEFYKELPSE